MESCIYEGWVRHRRLTPVENNFRVKVSLIYLALEELDTVFKGRWLWSTQRFSFAEFRRRDYLGSPLEDLRVSVTKLINEHGGDYEPGPIRLLTHLRYWGFGFNPVSFYYCYSLTDPSKLEYIVAEVTNTPWREKHSYVLKASQFDPLNPTLIPKTFHVSPFMDMDMGYQFRITHPDDKLLIHMANLRQETRIFDVTMSLKKRPLTTMNLAKVLVRYPAMTLQVVGHIYFQALRLWWKGVPYVPHPSSGLPHGNLVISKDPVNIEV